MVGAWARPLNTSVNAGLRGRGAFARPVRPDRPYPAMSGPSPEGSMTPSSTQVNFPSSTSWASA